MSTNPQIRHATWLELFFDLIFVVAIAKATHVLQHVHHGHIGLETYGKFLLIMIPIWWAWVGATMYANRYDTDDLVHRLMYFGQMFCIIIMAAHINVDFDATFQGFLLSYVAIRGFTILMHLRAARHGPEEKSISGFLAIVFTIGALISLSSLLLEGPARYIVLYAGIAFEVILPLTAKARLKAAPVNAHHMPERFGLLAIILLGESVLSLTTDFETLDWSAQSIAMASSGFALACAIWWLYFENIERRISGLHLGHGHGVLYSHFLIYVGLGGIAGMIHFAVIQDLTLLDYKLMTGFGLFSFLLALQFLHFLYHPKDLGRHLVRNALVVDLALITLLLVAPSTTALMAGATLLMVAYAVLDHLSDKIYRAETTEGTDLG